MIIFKEIETIKQFTQIELRNHMLETIRKITDGAFYDPSIYGHFALVEVGDSIAEIEAKTGCQLMHGLSKGNQTIDCEFQPSFEWLVEHLSFFEVVFYFLRRWLWCRLIDPKSFRN